MSTVQNVANGNQVVSQQKTNKRKCWICLAVVELDCDEISILKDLFLAKNLYKSSKTLRINDFVQLRLLFDKIILSSCKCRKKLAHVKCFNNYIDVRQDGNINIQIACPQCNLKYEFTYPYNGVILQIFDLFDQCLNTTGQILMITSLIAAVYWCSFSYGVLTLMQIYGNEQGTQIIKNLNIVTSAVVLPVIPIVLVSCRFIPWQHTLEKLFPFLFKFKSKDYSNKYDDSDNEIENDSNEYFYSDENGSYENTKLLKKIRLVVGGLALPSIAVVIEKLIFSLVKDSGSSSILRTSMIGLTFVGVKGIAKLIYRRKKTWEEENKSIQNYNT